ncbi:hypothetical protein PGIGA_G00141320 [Pangasianodon gigas]|uniref:Uncharacterized protein n=1 Tax=Pangasianodon gigas TaxID=30993 RepID=A0ACC5XLQ7_PANGG|nr:hypothetical protein [Pangasianodon gigas]
MPSQEPLVDERSGEEEVELPPEDTEDTEDTDRIAFLPHSRTVDKAEDDPEVMSHY